MKLDLQHNQVVVLRKGGVTKDTLEQVLADALNKGLLTEKVNVEYSEKLSKSAEAMMEKEKSTPNEAQESPGLLLRHYSTSVPSALLAVKLLETHAGEKLPYEVDRSILIDFGGQMRHCYDYFKKTFDLCSTCVSPGANGSVEEACARAFAVLREAEAFAEANGVGFICIADFDAPSLGGIAEALYDRMFRAASGRRVALCSQDKVHFRSVSGGSP